MDHSSALHCYTFNYLPSMSNWCSMCLSKPQYLQPKALLFPPKINALSLHHHQCGHTIMESRIRLQIFYTSQLVYKLIMQSYFFYLINNLYIYTFSSICTGAVYYLDYYYSLFNRLGILSSKIWQRNLSRTNDNNNENVIPIMFQLQTIFMQLLSLVY